MNQTHKIPGLKIDALFEEYLELGRLPEITLPAADRIGYILDLAQSDENLDRLINEADRILNQEILPPEKRGPQFCQSQRAKFRNIEFP